MQNDDVNDYLLRWLKLINEIVTSFLIYKNKSRLDFLMATTDF